ncbi:MAG: DEAD/DEAH box helicase family protein [archaeon]
MNENNLNNNLVLEDDNSSNLKFLNSKYLKKDKIEYRLYQELLAAISLNQSTLIVAPTGLGKTIIAVYLISEMYKPEKSILFLSPTKPLISQHKKSLENLLTIDSKKIVLLTGEISKEKRVLAYKEKGQIICATPQTIRNDILSNLINQENFNLIIFDEAHRAVGDYSYIDISKFFSKDIKRLALTASPGSSKNKILEVKDNLMLSHIEIRTEDSFDVKEYTKDVDVEIINLELDKYSKEISKLIDEFINKRILILRKLGFPLSKNYTKKEIIVLQARILQRASRNKSLFFALSYTSMILKVYHGKELIETQGFYALRLYLDKLFSEGCKEKASKAIKQIVLADEFKKILSILDKAKANEILSSKDLELIKIVNDFILINTLSKILVFNNFRDNASYLVNLLNKNEKIKSVRFVGQASKGEDKGLSQKEQAEILNDFKSGKYNCLVATCVAEEGLDIPLVDLVVFYDAVPSEIRSIQRRGRTGRFSAGKVVVLINKDTIDERYYYVSENKEAKMKNILSKFDFNDTNKQERKPYQKKQKSLSDFA